jgi:signal transduction histidine kinase
VAGDEKRIILVLLNLVSNALEFSNEKGDIKVTVQFVKAKNNDREQIRLNSISFSS